MPIYEYRCAQCDSEFEVIQKFSDAPLDSCRSCGGGPVSKLVSQTAFQFKGSGWYVTDYARKDSGKSAASSSSESTAKSTDSSSSSSSDSSKKSGD